jgi:hypothetical protein
LHEKKNISSFNLIEVVFLVGVRLTMQRKLWLGKDLLLNITRGMNVPVNIMFNLFDACVLSVMNYGCEVLGF